MTYGAIKRVEWLTSNSTHLFRWTGGFVNYSLPPVIFLHGWPGTDDWQTHLSTLIAPPVGYPGSDMSALEALLATGRVVYRPFSGGNWGMQSTIWPGTTGGTGLECIDDCIEQSLADGFGTSLVDLWGTSMGAVNALNWAWRNPDSVHRIFGVTPAFDLSFIYDADVFIAASMRNVHGGANKPAWLPLSQPYDPYRQTGSLIEAIAKKTAFFADRDDLLVPWDTLEHWCSFMGIKLYASTEEGVTGGGHGGAFAKPGWDDLIPLRHFDS